MKTKAKTAFGGVWRRVSRQRGVGVGGGAPGHVGEARGRRWPRWLTSAAAGAFGEREQRRGRKPWESERVQGKVGAMHVALGVDSSSGKQARGGRTRARARRPRARPPGKGKTTGRSPWWAGPASYSAGPVGGRQVSFLCSVLFLFCFPFINSFCHCFELQTN